jgi:hypothetical protein
VVGIQAGRERASRTRLDAAKVAGLLVAGSRREVYASGNGFVCGVFVASQREWWWLFLSKIASVFIFSTSLLRPAVFH